MIQFTGVSNTSPNALIQNAYGVPSGVAPFSPSDIAGLALWLDASDAATITQSAGAVSQWDDKSGLNNHATQGTGSNQPITNSRTLNSLNVLDFDGTNDALILPSSLYTIPNGNNTVFIVYQSDTIDLIKRVLSGQTGATTNYGVILVDNVVNAASQYSVRNGGNAQALRLADTNPHIGGLKRNGSTLDSYLDGLFMTSALGSNVTLDQLLIGHNVAGTATQAFDGIIAEVIIYNNAISTADCNLIGAYLAAKWAVSWTPI